MIETLLVIRRHRKILTIENLINLQNILNKYRIQLRCIEPMYIVVYLCKGGNVAGLL